MIKRNHLALDIVVFIYVASEHIHVGYPCYTHIPNTEVVICNNVFFFAYERKIIMFQSNCMSELIFMANIYRIYNIISIYIYIVI